MVSAPGWNLVFLAYLSQRDARVPKPIPFGSDRDIDLNFSFRNFRLHIFYKFISYNLENRRKQF